MVSEQSIYHRSTDQTVKELPRLTRVGPAYGAHSTNVTTPTNTFNIPTPAFVAAQNTNIVSSFAAMREALASFTSPSTSPSTPGPKTFIFTGNTLNQGSIPGFLALGAGKAGAAWMVESADSITNRASPYYSLPPLPEGGEQDIRFHYVDERKVDGTPLFTGLGAQGHAEAFWGLAERREGWRGAGWLVTFVSGEEGGNETRVKEFPTGVLLPEGRELKGREDYAEWIRWVMTQ